MNFKLGQKVVCISDEGWDKKLPTPLKDKVYIISGFYSGTFGKNDKNTWIHLAEFPQEFCYNSACFRPLDYDFASSLLEEIESEINEENLVPA